MENLSIWEQIKRIYAFETATKADWQELSRKTHIQFARNVLLVFMSATLIGYIIGGKSFLNILVVVLLSLLIYIFINEKTVGALKLVSVVVCLGITWFRIFLVGWQTTLYNQIHMVIIPLPLFLFTGSYRITFFSFIYCFFFTKYNGEHIRREFENSPDEFEKNLNYLFDNFYPLKFVVWIFLSFIVYQKHFLVSQLWIQQKEKEKLLLEVQNKNEQLEKLYKEKAKLLLGLSHEFRNPINAALGNLELANEKITDPGIQKYLVNCKVSIEMLYHLVSNLLDSTKLEAGILELNPSRKDSNTMFQKVWGIVKNLLDKQNLVGEFYIHKKIPKMLDIDSHFAIKILLNLILNAIKYTHQGAVMTVVTWIDGDTLKEEALQPTSEFYVKFLNMFTKKKKVEENLLTLRSSQELVSGAIMKSTEKYNDTDVPSEPSPQLNQLLKKHTSQLQNSLMNIEKFQNMSKYYNKLTNIKEAHNTKLIPQNSSPQQEVVYQGKGFLKIEVFDSGCGIDFKEVKDSIFKKSSSNPLQTGDRLSLGLGLWLTKSLCECMGGQVKAFSEKDKGSQFIAIIPAEASDLQSEEEISMNIIEARTLPVELNALVVDDDKYNREINSIFLTKAGVTVKAEAVNGNEALQIFMSKPPKYFDLVVMDLEMPVMNGKEAVRKIRQYEKRIGACPVKVIIATGNCDLTEYSQCMDKNGDIRADFFYRKPLLRKDVEEFVDLLRREKAQQRPSCIVVDGDSLTVELLQSFVKNCSTHIFPVNSVDRAEIIMREWKGNIRWVLLNLNTKSEQIESFVNTVRGLDSKIEIIGLSDSLDAKQNAYCTYLKIKRVLRFPLNKEEITEIFTA